MTNRIITVPQNNKIPIIRIESYKYFYRYTFSPSYDSLKAGDNGQDFIMIIESGNRVVFSLCDGVSQSFIAELVSRFLGEALSRWMVNIDFDNGYNKNLSELENFLSKLPEEASLLINNYKLPSNIPVVLKEILEAKRIEGGETTFVSGVIDLTKDAIFLAWVGDSRLRLWDDSKEIKLSYENSHDHWSSKKGLVGKLGSFQNTRKQIIRLLTYSDGLSILDNRSWEDFASDDTLNKIVSKSLELPSSDDVSLIEIDFQ